jgi:hypothetical protein
MLRFEISDGDGQAMPAIDLDDAVVVIGSAADAKIRLPASVARPEHVIVRASEVGDGKTFELGSYRVRVFPAPAGTVAASPQRTESLARELVRGLLGPGAAAVLEVESGLLAGARRALAAPESMLVIGRGDEAGWIIDDEDLSRAHAEVRRRWDGTWLRDLGSKNGTRADGQALGTREVRLRDGSRIELGKLALMFRDPAERHLRGEVIAHAPVASAVPGPQRVRRRSAAAYYVAIAMCLLALAALAWVLMV